MRLKKLSKLVPIALIVGAMAFGCGKKNTGNSVESSVAETTNTEESTEAITEKETETEAETEKETEKETETESESVTETETETEAATEAPTKAPEKPTEAPTKAPEKPTEAPTKAPEKPTEAPKPPVLTDNTTESDTIKNLIAGNLYLECNGSNGVTYDLVKMYNKGGKYYFFLPSYADNSKLIFWETVIGDVTIDGKLVPSGTQISLPNGEHAFTYNGKNVTINVLHSANVPSIFISSTTNLVKLKSDKNNTAAGSITFIDKNGGVATTGLDKMKGRGNTSWNAGQLFGKYPFNINLSEKVNVFGIATNKKWCLLANVFDESLIRNNVMFELAAMENLQYTPGYENVDVYYNNEYIGTYLLTQKVDVGKNSLLYGLSDLEKANKQANPNVNLDSLKRTSVGGDLNSYEKNSYKYCEGMKNPSDISGGYLLEFELNERYAQERCGFVTAKGQPVVIKSPENCSKEEVEFIRKYVQRVEDAVYSSTGKDSYGKHYSQLIDMDSFAKVYLINEISMNLDATATSFYLYLDKGSVLKAGPVWDFDWALGSYQNRDGVDLTKGDAWYVRYKKIYGHSSLDIMATLCTQPDFIKKVKSIWEGSMSGNLQKIINKIDSYGNYYSATANMNFRRYDILTAQPQWGSADTGTTYNANIAYLKKFLERRKAFLAF